MKCETLVLLNVLWLIGEWDCADAASHVMADWEAAFAVGGSSACWLNGNGFQGGQVQCGGFEPDDNHNLLAGLDLVGAQVSCCDASCCALEQSSGLPWCWNHAGELLNSPTESMVQVALTSSTACGIRAIDRRVSCWKLSLAPSHDADILLAPPMEKASTIACGVSQCCIIQANGNQKKKCWGNAKNFAPEPSAPDIQSFERLVAGNGGSFVFAIHKEDWVGFGINSHGVLSKRPKDALAEHLVAGKDFACATTQSDRAKLWCWGRGLVSHSLKSFAAEWKPDDNIRMAAGVYAVCSFHVDQHIRRKCILV